MAMWQDGKARKNEMFETGVITAILRQDLACGNKYVL